MFEHLWPKRDGKNNRLSTANFSVGKQMRYSVSQSVTVPSPSAQIRPRHRFPRPSQTPARSQSARSTEAVQSRNAPLHDRFRRPLHQQPGRAGPQDDEGQNENLRRLPNPRWRSDLRSPQVHHLNREETRPQHPPDHRRPSKPRHPSPRRLTANKPGLGVTQKVRQQVQPDRRHVGTLAPTFVRELS